MADGNREIISSRFGLHFASVDPGYLVHPESESLLRYLEYGGSHPCGLFELFPELVGFEDMVAGVISGRREEFVVRDINRDARKEIYYNLNLLHSKNAAHPLLLIVEDITTECKIRQSLQQSRNEITLLHNQLLIKNSDLDRANTELRKSQQELQQLNQQLESKVRERTEQLESSTMLARRLFEQTVNSLMMALEKRDSYTAGHQERVSVLAAAIARELELDEKTVEGIRIAGKLHDLGKIYVPSDFLTKPDPLSEEEFSVIRTHPRVGFDILQNIEFPWPVASIVLQHHERMDGSGYPFGLEGKDILLEAKILAVADGIEAMATNRPYRISPGIDEALNDVMKYSGSWYDPEVVKACVRLFRKKGFVLPPVQYRTRPRMPLE